MEKDKAIKILQTLANGIDPVTGKVFPTESPYQNVEVVRALFYALDSIKNTTHTINTFNISDKPVQERVGKPWSEQEDQELKEAFQQGQKIDDLSKKHQRTSGAIRSRLVKLGLLELN